MNVSENEGWFWIYLPRGKICDKKEKKLEDFSKLSYFLYCSWSDWKSCKNKYKTVKNLKKNVKFT